MAKVVPIPRMRAKRSPRPKLDHQFLVVLSGTNPLVWRRIQVPHKYSFWDLHVAIQDSGGWLDCHLHEFRVVLDSKTGRLGRFGIPVDDMLPPIQPDWTVNVSDVQLDTRGKYPRCLSGASKCPPEDCGGVHGYAELLKATSDPKHERHAEFAQWTGTASFDPNVIDFQARAHASTPWLNSGRESRQPGASVLPKLRPSAAFNYPHLAEV